MCGVDIIGCLKCRVWVKIWFGGRTVFWIGDVVIDGGRVWGWKLGMVMLE